jgi:hypothetical protein
MEEARDALKFPAKTRGVEFNFSKVSRQDEGSNSTFQKFPAKTTYLPSLRSRSAAGPTNIASAIRPPDLAATHKETHRKKQNGQSIW